MKPWEWIRKVGALIVGVALIEYLAVPQLVKARSELTLFADASLWLMIVAFVLETASLLCYTALTRTVLPTDGRVSFRTQFQIDLTGLGASHLLPGGGASASALRYRLMTSRGLPAADALSTAAVETAISVMGLIATFTAGVVLASPSIWTHPIYLLAGIGGLTLLAAAYVGIRIGIQPRTSFPRFPPVTVRSSRLARWSANTVMSARTIAYRGLDLMRHRDRRRALFIWAMGNWLFDAASLWFCLHSYGVTVHPGAVVVAYGAANLVGLLPLTPGGLGIVEGILIPSLTALGAAGGPVVLGVLTWRALEFWLPIPIAGIAYLSLRLNSYFPSSNDRTSERTDGSSADKHDAA